MTGSMTASTGAQGPNNMAMGGTGGMMMMGMMGMMPDSGQDAAILEMADRMQETIQKLSESIIDQRVYVENRDAWLETRLTQLERRCQKVEVLEDRLAQILCAMEVTDLDAIPRD